MPIVTRSRKHIEKDEGETTTSKMGDNSEREENTFNIEELTEEKLQEAEQDPRFHNLMERILE